jgi:hypothetical protein
MHATVDPREPYRDGAAEVMPKLSIMSIDTKNAQQESGVAPPVSYTWTARGETGYCTCSSVSEFELPSATESETDFSDDAVDTAVDATAAAPRKPVDEADLTPTATPRPKKALASVSSASQLATTPVGAVELKPYHHQVGGHTTVFRFSKRAVCKSMSNRENEFYETVELKHPELLCFLPRFVIFLQFLPISGVAQAETSARCPLSPTGVSATLLRRNIATIVC